MALDIMRKAPAPLAAREIGAHKNACGPHTRSHPTFCHRPLYAGDPIFLLQENGLPGQAGQ
jgi:hypothetical protein